MRPFSQKTVERLLRWYITQPEAERHECHAEQKQRINVIMNEARKQGQKVEANGDIYYRAFLFGIDKRCRLQDNRRLKNSDDLANITMQRIAVEKAKIKAKPSPKLDRLHADLGPVVVKLRNEALSWQKVSDYLAKYHKCRYSRGYLQKVFAGSETNSD